VRIGKIAENMGVSIKTLERRFQKTIGLTPKSFSAIIQLHQAARSIQKKNPIISHGDLTEALGNGYYDQSHFIKSCLRITGFTPKKLFTHLQDQMTDLVIV
jgi:AraC-like DNA-binding protein